jgi:hypothetical protein
MLMRVFIFAVGVLTIALAAVPAHAGAYCQQRDTAPAPLPASLVPAVEKAFGLHNADPAWVERSTVVRCMGGRLLACNMGANLPCGKANTALSLPAGDDWCRQNPNSDFVPAYISGHDSAEHWRCINGVPAIAGPPDPIDRQGYLTNYWKILE